MFRKRRGGCMKGFILGYIIMISYRNPINISHNKHNHTHHLKIGLIHLSIRPSWILSCLIPISKWNGHTLLSFAFLHSTEKCENYIILRKMKARQRWKHNGWVNYRGLVQIRCIKSKIHRWFVFCICSSCDANANKFKRITTKMRKTKENRIGKASQEEKVRLTQ